ncbi:hypothetical protein MHYP_G00182130 [Metynnis hypsauchen]
MQSSYRPPENFPLQGPAGHGTVVISMPEHPKDYIVWSLASMYFGNPLCLGLLAFYFSVKSRDRKIMGDLEGAKAYGSTACCFNGWALALIIAFAILLIVLIVLAAKGSIVILSKFFI